MTRTPWIVLFAACLLGPARQARGWGQYGHEQINIAAVDLLKAENDPAANMSPTSEDVIKRLAITPDMDWKMIGRAPEDPSQYDEKKLADSMEHPLHFFEADAFEDPARGVSSLDALPTGDYAHASATLQADLDRNQKAVSAADPGKPLQSAAHGTAPWRILQLYDLGLGAFKAGDFPKAALYLGALGHYVGDMAQPFHTTLDFDGGAYPRPAAGVHSAFEERILEAAAIKRMGGKNQTKDQFTLLWDVSATQEQVMFYAKAAYGSGLPVPRERIVPEIMSLVRSGYGYVDPVLKTWAAVCAKAQSGTLPTKSTADPGDAPYCVGQSKGPGDAHPAVRTSVAMIDAFASARVEGKATIMDLAEQRMGAAAALLARIWKSAYNEAGRPKLGEVNLTFEQLDAIGNYPKPSYLGGDMVSRPRHDPGHAVAAIGEKLHAGLDRVRQALGR